MGRSLTVADQATWEDIRTYLTRARAVDDDGAVRIQAIGGAAGLWTCALAPHGLLDTTPTVLGLRTVGLAVAEQLDAVVSLGGVLDRMPRDAAEAGAAGDGSTTGGARVLRLPPHDAPAPWAGISPQLSGWEPLTEVAAQDLVATARAGIQEVADAVPTDSGQEMVDRVRSAVWGRTASWGSTPEDAREIPEGAAFAAWALGFLRADEDSAVPVARRGGWLRLTCPGGFVLVR